MSLAERLQRDWWRREPTALTTLLAPASGLYRLGAWLQRHRARPWRAPVPVVVVGNLIVGGAGKTPTVIALVQALRARGWTPGIVSRGYGRQDEQLREVVPGSSAAGEVGDEPLLMAIRTGAPVVVGQDRSAAARELLRRHPQVDVLVSDDGLQHWRLARDLELVVFDERGVGNGRLLPAGPLREALWRGNWPGRVILYNAPAPSTPLPGVLLKRRLSGAVELSRWWGGATPDAAVLDGWRGRTVLAAAGLAHPEKFFRMLRDEGLQPDALPLPDHHRFDALPWPAETQDVLVTEKDAVKLPPERVGRTRVWVVTLDLSLPSASVDQWDAWLRQRRSPSLPPA